MSIGTVINATAPRSGAGTRQPPGADDPVTATAFAGVLAALTAPTAPEPQAAEQGVTGPGAPLEGQEGGELAPGSLPAAVAVAVVEAEAQAEVDVDVDVDVDADADVDADVDADADADAGSDPLGIAVPATPPAAVPVTVAPSADVSQAETPTVGPPQTGGPGTSPAGTPTAAAASGDTAAGDVEGSEHAAQVWPESSRSGVRPAGEVHGAPAPTAAPAGHEAETSAPTTSQSEAERDAELAAPGQSSAPTTAAPATTRPPVTARAVPTPLPVPPADLGLHVTALKGADGDHVLRMSLHPVELGAVRVDVRVDGDQVTVSVLAASDAAVEAVRLALPELRAQLETAGLLVTDLEVGPDHGEDEETAGQHAASGEAKDGRPDEPDADPAVPGVPGTDGSVTTAPTEHRLAERGSDGHPRRSIDVRL